mmetsp:Transcript_10516/g.21277  ORF Transcript_10516/g.21277 Transcript_10516/m.21277 type:complete len:216 (-) Transcript_10516:45-692(-)
MPALRWGWLLRLSRRDDRPGASPRHVLSVHSRDHHPPLPVPEPFPLPQVSRLLRRGQPHPRPWGLLGDGILLHLPLREGGVPRRREFRSHYHRALGRSSKLPPLNDILPYWLLLHNHSFVVRFRVVAHGGSFHGYSLQHAGRSQVLFVPNIQVPRPRGVAQWHGHRCLILLPLPQAGAKEGRIRQELEGERRHPRLRDDGGSICKFGEWSVKSGL